MAKRNNQTSLTVIRATYNDAHTRGLLRQFKQRLAKDYVTFDKGVHAFSKLSHLGNFIRRASIVGRQRAFDKIRRVLGPGAYLEALRLDGKEPIALFSILNPRGPVIVGPKATHSDKQDCIAVDYIIVAQLDGRATISNGLWSLYVPDHALGRAISAYPVKDPSQCIREAHHNLLLLDAKTASQISLAEKSFLVKAGDGAFICEISISEDVSLNFDLSASVRAHTWIATDMLYTDQHVHIGNGEPGQRLIDNLLLPSPLCRLGEISNHNVAVTWTHSELPELLVSAKRHMH